MHTCQIHPQGEPPNPQKKHTSWRGNSVGASNSKSLSSIISREAFVRSDL